MSHLERVAVVGASGRIGNAIVTELLKTGKHTVTALTRGESKISLPETVNVVRVDYSDHQSLVSALKNQQFLVITLSIAASADAHGNIVKAAEAAGVRYVMPNFYGGDILNKGIMEESMNGKMYKQRFRDFEGVQTPWIVLVCGFWYEFSLALQEPSFGFDVPGRTVTFFDDGRTKINVSTWSQCGRAVAALLGLPENGTSPCVADWQNKPLYISSFRVSQRDMLDSINRVLGTTDEHWTINYEPTDKRFNRGLEALSKGDRMGFPIASYSRVFYPQGDGDFESRQGLSNDVLHLPQEDFDEATNRALDMIASGWTPF